MRFYGMSAFNHGLSLKFSRTLIATDVLAAPPAASLRGVDSLRNGIRSPGNANLKLKQRSQIDRRGSLLVRKKIPTSTDQEGNSASRGSCGRGGRGGRAEQVSDGPESSAGLRLVHGHQGKAI